MAPPYSANSARIARSGSADGAAGRGATAGRGAGAAAAAVSAAGWRGGSGCTATLSGENPTGTRKCFNTVKTCQDKANFETETVTLRFTKDSGMIPPDIDCLPLLTSVSLSPADLMMCSWSRSHCTAEPVTAIEPSRA